MKPSKFNVFIPLPSEDEEYLVFNTLTDSRVTVGGELKRAMEKARLDGAFDPEVQAYLEPLQELGIVVADEEDEELTARHWLQRNKFSTEILDVVLLTTYACNLACGYCFEKRIHSNGMMDGETCRKVVAWVGQRLDQVRPRRLHLTFYGGEPLLNPEAIRYLSQKLQVEASHRGVEVEITLATNGVLLSRDLVMELLPYGLNAVKVTLDGDREAHDARRPSRDGRPKFDRIFSNLLAIKELVPLIVVGNYDQANKGAILTLLDRLQAFGFQDAIREMGFRPILPGLAAASPSESSCSLCSLSDGEVEDLLSLSQEVRQRGFTGRELVSTAPCVATREHSCVIDPGGKIYKCVAFLGREEFAIGDLSAPSFNQVNARFVAAGPWPACKGCEYLPLCDGGCRSSAYLKGGDIREMACERPFFEQVAMKWVGLDYLTEEARSESVGNVACSA